MTGLVYCSGSRALYERFYDGFASHGEPNIPFDKAFLRSEPFYVLLARLKQHVEEHQRDHWCAPQALHPSTCVIFVQGIKVSAWGSARNALVGALQLHVHPQERLMHDAHTRTSGAGHGDR